MNLLLLPIAVPLALVWLPLATGRRRWTRSLVPIAAIVSLSVGVVTLMSNSSRDFSAVAIAARPPPFGIALVADDLSALMLTLTGAVAALVSCYPLRRAATPRAEAAVLLMLAGVNGAVLTADLFNLYVWFEVMVLASIAVLAGESPRRSAVVKYVVLNVINASFMLFGISLVYATTGTLSYADLALFEYPTADPRLFGAVVVVLFAFMFKAAVFPLFFWLPAAYPTLGFASAALFSGLFSKVGVYALYRSLLTLFPDMLQALQPLLAVVAGATMLVGVLGAAAQHDVRRILSFHIISQIGYLLMGLAIGTRLAISAGLFFLVHVVLVKAGLFLVGGVASRVLGSARLGEGGGLLTRAPSITVCFGILAASIAGVPPLSGFWSKLGLIVAGIDAGHGWLVAAAVSTGLLTLFSMTKIWQAMFWGTSEQVQPAGVEHVGFSVAALVLLVVGISAWPEGLFRITERASQQLSEPGSYASATAGAEQASAAHGGSR